MLCSVRVATKLEDAHKKFYTNASESTNNISKLKVNRTPQSLPSFVDHMYELVISHEKNIDRAMYKQRTLSLWRKVVSKEDSCSVMQAHNIIFWSWCSYWFICCYGYHWWTKLLKKLTVPYQSLIESGSQIHEHTLKGMWKKAGSLVNDSTLVVAVAGSFSTSYHRMVALNNKCSWYSPLGNYSSQVYWTV